MQSRKPTCCQLFVLRIIKILDLSVPFILKTVQLTATVVYTEFHFNDIPTLRSVLRPVLMVTEYTPVKSIPFRNSMHPMQTFGFYFKSRFCRLLWWNHEKSASYINILMQTTPTALYINTADAPIGALSIRLFPKCGVQLKYLTKLRNTLTAYCCVPSFRRRRSSTFYFQGVNTIYFDFFGCILCSHNSAIFHVFYFRVCMCTLFGGILGHHKNWP